VKQEETKYLYIPVEVKARELNAKILLSLFAADAGFFSVVGKRDTLRKKIRKMNSGIVIEKGLDSPGKEKNIREYQLCGNRVAAVDEEGLVYFEKYYINRRIREKALKNVDVFIAWGENQADLIKNAFPDLEERVYICGNSRLDLLRKEFRNEYLSEVNDIKSRYNNFILINSALSIVSLKEGFDGFLRKVKETGFLKDKKDADFFWGQVDYYKAIFNEMTDMVTRISKEFSDKKIIIRPHPSEDPVLWNEKVGHRNNVEVVYEGNVVPWLLAADIMIHHNCTTAIESFLLGKPAISYRSISSDEYDCKITHAASLQVFSIDELLNTLKRILEQNEKLILPDNFRNKLQEYLCVTEDEYASERIVKELIILTQTDNIRLIKYFSFIFKIYYRLYKFVGSNIIKRIFQPLREKKQREYFDYKFPDTELAEVIAIVDKFKKATGRFDNIKVDTIGKNLFALYRPH